MHRVRLFIMSVFMLVTPVLWAETSAVPMLEATANQIIQTLKTNQAQLKSNYVIIQHAVLQYLVPHVDVTGMSRSVLGRNAWNQATPAEKKEFTSVFTQLVIRTYATPLAEYNGETITFSPQQANGRFARVNSVIKRPNGQTIPLSYALVLKDGSWKVYDFSVEGVSLLQSFRNQFSDVLQKSDMKSLIAQMKQHQSAS